jgi:hypothetical protein
MITNDDSQLFFLHARKHWTLRAEITKLGRDYAVEIFNRRRGVWVRHVNLRITPTRIEEWLQLASGNPTMQRNLVYYWSNGSEIIIVADPGIYNDDMFGYQISIPNRTASLYSMPAGDFDRLFGLRSFFGRFP